MLYSIINPDQQPPEPPTLPPVAPSADPERVRTIVYYVLLGLSAISLLVEALAPIYLGEHTALIAVETIAALMSVAGLIAGALGVAVHQFRARI